MTAHSLPDRPDLDQLRRRAKELRNAARDGEPEALARLAAHRPAGAPVTLAAAQSVVAREHGHASWPQLKAAVEERQMSREQRARALVVASVSGRMDRAVRLVEADPSLVTDNVWTAVALGEAARVRALLARDPALAVEPDPESGWTPLLVACNSRWHQIDPGRGSGLREAAEVLMDAGAPPDTSVGRVPEPSHCSVLYAAAGLANHPELAGLLERGADPDARGQDGQSAHRLAVRQGRSDVVDLLRSHGARDDATDVDRFLAACVRADRPEAEAHLASRPGLVDELTDQDHKAIAHAADHGDLPAAQLMLNLGFPLNAPVGDDGASPLHAAAGAGAAELVAFLVERGADIEATDTTWGATPLCWATVGSGFGLGHNQRADWVTTVEILIAAGASTEGVWATGKPPSDDVAAVLATHGVHPPIEDDDEDAEVRG